ncbi:hypothetical protein BDR22DRAFT_889215 [Usnea florida]
MESAALQSKKSMTSWPLVTAIKIDLKTDILKHGLVLVDIPGALQDTDSARANIAQSFKAQSTDKLIFADVTRAAENPDLVKHVSGILWRGATTGDYERITVVLTQFDKGSITEMERRLVEEAEYQSIKAE